MNRRDFLKAATKGLGMVALAPLVPSLPELNYCNYSVMFDMEAVRDLRFRVEEVLAKELRFTEICTDLQKQTAIRCFLRKGRLVRGSVHADHV